VTDGVDGSEIENVESHVGDTGELTLNIGERRAPASSVPIERGKREYHAA
jgi:hypothetical protein